MNEGRLACLNNTAKGGLRDELGQMNTVTGTATGNGPFTGPGSIPDDDKLTV